jgi:hypothetical protein
MMLLDVINEATTQHEVYFLLHAYIEYLRRLPVHGLPDIEERVAELTLHLAGTGLHDRPMNRALVQEAHAILAAALTRLSWLDTRTAVVRSSAAPETVTTP